jgi:hypothetical protein
MLTLIAITAQVEALLKKQDKAESSTVTNPGDLADNLNIGTQSQYPGFDIPYTTNDPLTNTLNLFPDITQSQAHAHLFAQILEDNIYSPPPNDPFDGMSWALIELGVDEPLPLQETIDDL